MASSRLEGLLRRYSNRGVGELVDRTVRWVYDGLSFRTGQADRTVTIKRFWWEQHHLTKGAGTILFASQVGQRVFG